jgi:hypothetical protein
MAPGDLARQQRCIERIRARWPAFLQARQAHLRSHSVGQAPAEKVAENILCDLFTQVLDWTTEQARLRENLIDLTLTRLGVKYLIVEAKRPGSLDGPGSIGRAVKQARGYAEKHKVDKIAVSDGCILEAYDLAGPRLDLRVRMHLSAAEPPESLWWLSTRGIYRTPENMGAAPPGLLWRGANIWWWRSPPPPPTTPGCSAAPHAASGTRRAAGHHHRRCHTRGTGDRGAVGGVGTSRGGPAGRVLGRGEGPAARAAAPGPGQRPADRVRMTADLPAGSDVWSRNSLGSWWRSVGGAQMHPVLRWAALPVLRSEGITARVGGGSPLCLVTICHAGQPVCCAHRC